MPQTSPFDLDKQPVASPLGSADAVPVIGIDALINEPGGERARTVAAEISAACRRWGFFQVIDHGIPPSLVDDVWRKARTFFSSPRNGKEALLRSRENPWGYYNNELTKNQRDRKEVFDFCGEGKDRIYGADNRWPVSPPAFRPVMEAYFSACERVSLALLESFCVGLALPPDFLSTAFVPDHTGFMRLNYYPVGDPLAGSSTAHLAVADLGVHHHTDAGVLTVLLQDRVGGLQVYFDDAWHDIPVVEGALVVNTGDMMQVWSNDIYKAAIHRVVAMEREDRFSIPFFFNPAAGTVVEPLPSTVSASQPAAYRPIDWAGFRGRRTDGDYADYGPEVQISQYRTGR